MIDHFIMNKLPLELVYYLTNWLKDYDKRMLLSTCKNFLSLQSCVYYEDIYYYEEIHKLSYHQMFRKVELELCKFKTPIPKIVTNLEFDVYFNEPLINRRIKIRNKWVKIRKIIPSTVKYLDMGYSFNKSIRGALSYGLTTLIFGPEFNQPIDNCIPSTVTYLEFSVYFDQPVVGYLPPGLTHLIFGTDFNQPIKGALPDTLEYLYFGWSFNQPIDFALPPNLKCLKFGHCFDQPIKGFLPLGLNKLIFEGEYHQPMDLAIPESVEYLKLGNPGSNSLENCLPINLKTLVFGENFNKNLNTLSLDKFRELEKIEFDGFFDQKISSRITIDNVIKSNNFIETFQNFYGMIKYYFNDFINPNRQYLPENVKHIIISTYLYDKICSNISNDVFIEVYN
ncbi:FNIP repeat-containing protein [Acanthamoeba polyphaga mimivirus]|nr:FNIP repeat-containing protein [Acanthamoeba castellanii mamavirus]EJN41057.1 hypothetical protein lvs_R554 [Acanthamoeba polyphaga lentillevirus]UMZ07823.1 FNIP repeat-containing protein [Acanthamoeba polyphaga mimivirus]